MHLLLGVVIRDEGLLEGEDEGDERPPRLVRVDGLGVDRFKWEGDRFKWGGAG